MWRCANEFLQVQPLPALPNDIMHIWKSQGHPPALPHDAMHAWKPRGQEKTHTRILLQARLQKKRQTHAPAHHTHTNSSPPTRRSTTFHRSFRQQKGKIVKEGQCSKGHSGEWRGGHRENDRPSKSRNPSKLIFLGSVTRDVGSKPRLWFLLRTALADAVLLLLGGGPKMDFLVSAIDFSVEPLDNDPDGTADFWRPDPLPPPCTRSSSLRISSSNCSCCRCSCWVKIKSQSISRRDLLSKS